MRDELLAGFKWVERFFGEPANSREFSPGGREKIPEDSRRGELAIGDMISIEEWSEFIPGNDEEPYAFVADLYRMRQIAKSKKEYDIVGKAIKLVLNSLYGKTVQSVGGTEDKPPSCACPYYGAAITANCRARLLEAALIDPYAIVCFMTDGIVSTRELKGLPRVKEIFDGEPPEGVAIDRPGHWLGLGHGARTGQGPHRRRQQGQAPAIDMGLGHGARPSERRSEGREPGEDGKQPGA